MIIFVIFTSFLTESEFHICIPGLGSQPDIHVSRLHDKNPACVGQLNFLRCAGSGTNQIIKNILSVWSSSGLSYWLSMWSSSLLNIIDSNDKKQTETKRNELGADSVKTFLEY